MLPNSVSCCRAKPFKVLAAAPRPREKGRFRVAISDRPPSPPWDLRLPEIGTRARTGADFFPFFNDLAFFPLFSASSRYTDSGDLGLCYLVMLPGCRNRGYGILKRKSLRWDTIRESSRASSRADVILEFVLIAEVPFPPIFLEARWPSRCHVWKLFCFVLSLPPAGALRLDVRGLARRLRAVALQTMDQARHSDDVIRFGLQAPLRVR